MLAKVRLKQAIVSLSLSRVVSDDGAPINRLRNDSISYSVPKVVGHKKDKGVEPPI